VQERDWHAMIAYAENSQTSEGTLHPLIESCVCSNWLCTGSCKNAHKHNLRPDPPPHVRYWNCTGVKFGLDQDYKSKIKLMEFYFNRLLFIYSQVCPATLY